MTQQEYQMLKGACVQAASLGFAQTLVNKGYNPAVVRDAVIKYADPERGMITKRAAEKQAVRTALLKVASAIRGY